MSNKSKGPVIDSGLCRCCGTLKRCRILNVEYERMGSTEVYSDMIKNCFGLLISYLDGKLSDRLICATCVKRLRDAFSFRNQVQHCEKAFHNMKVYGSDDDGEGKEMIRPMKEEKGSPKLEVEIVKTEPMDYESDSNSHDVDDASCDYQDPKPEEKDQESNDDLPLQRLKRKAPGPQRPLKHKSLDEATSLPSNITIKIVNVVSQKPGTDTGVKPVTEKLDKTMIQKSNISMAKEQQSSLEGHPALKIETNTLNIIQYSYVCPFKCLHDLLLCYYCDQKIADPIKLREHTFVTHNPNTFTVTVKSMVKIDITRIDCRLCSQKIDNLKDFKDHLAMVHMKRYYFDMKESVLPFKLTEGSKCVICDVDFIHFHALNMHMNVHFGNYVCNACGLGFLDDRRLKAHRKRSHETSEYPCPTCGKVFKLKIYRDLHIDAVHKKRGRIYCPKCDVKLMNHPQKLKHLIEVHGEEPKSFPCTMCDGVFKTRRLFNEHRRKIHLKDFRYECETCGKKFFKRFALNNHMPTHTGERNFKCKFCEKTFPRRKTLQGHIRIHTNDRRYCCDVCGQSFIQKCSLNGHLKRHHPEKKES